MAFKLKPPFMALESEMSLDQTSTPPRNKRKHRRKFWRRRKGCGPRGCHGPKGGKSGLFGI